MDKMKFGIFNPPHHRPNQSPTLYLANDLELIVAADRLGFDEAWTGEHHGGGWEIISSPELMISAAAQRTHRIRLATGVAALSYQHPFIVANRLIQLDHMTRGRVIFGVGPGGHVSDAQMMGIDTNTQRRMMDEALDAITALLDGGEPVNRKTDWFELHDAYLHLPAYSVPRPQMATTAVASPSGPTMAGKYGIGLLSLGANTPAGFEFLSSTWAIAERAAVEHGTTVTRDDWRLVAPMHIAETEEEARKQVAYGLPTWINDYWSTVGQGIAPLPFGPGVSIDEQIDAVTTRRFGVIGTPEMAIEHIRNLREATDGFGGLLIQTYDWADPRDKLRSLELFARYVAPAINDQLAPQGRAQTWHKAHAAEIQENLRVGRERAKEDYRRRETESLLGSATQSSDASDS